MQFHDWGEDNFIRYLSQCFPVKDSIIGIGDDCAVIPGQEGLSWLLTADALVEGVHFLKDQISAKELGYKTIAVNVSDIAAMGGEPKYALLSLALPKHTNCTWICQVIEGVEEACKKWNISLLGGDTVGSKRDVFLNLTLIGSAQNEKIKYRNQAQHGDVICVSGYLGDAGGGLKALQTEVEKTEDITYLLHAHFHPEPSPAQGKWLASQKAVHALMDISDGLNCDLNRLIQSSQIGAVIETTQLPISAPLSRVSLINSWDSLQLALTGGEDYCLLMTVSKDAFEQIRLDFQQKFESPLFAIGRITNAHPKELIYHKNAKVIQVHYHNYDHFH